MFNYNTDFIKIGCVIHIFTHKTVITLNLKYDLRPLVFFIFYIISVNYINFELMEGQQQHKVAYFVFLKVSVKTCLQQYY